MVHSSSSDTVLLDLNLGGEKTASLIVQEVQHHPLGRHTLHIDFREVKPNQEVIVNAAHPHRGRTRGCENRGGGTWTTCSIIVKVRGTPSNLPEAP